MSVNLDKSILGVRWSEVMGKTKEGGVDYKANKVRAVFLKKP